MLNATSLNRGALMVWFTMIEAIDCVIVWHRTWTKILAHAGGAANQWQCLQIIAKYHSAADSATIANASLSSRPIKIIGIISPQMPCVSNAMFPFAPKLSIFAINFENTTGQHFPDFANFVSSYMMWRICSFESVILQINFYK